MAYIPPLNGGRLNASISGNTAGAGSLISTGTLYLAGGNNITLSQNGASISISGANAPSGSINFSAGTTSANLASVTFGNGGNVSFGLSNGVVTGSYSQTSQTLGIIQGLIAGVNTLSAGSVNLSASNGVTFGLNGTVLTASHNGITSQSNQTLGLNVTGNTIQSNTGTVDARSLTFRGMGNVNVGYSNGSVQISGSGGGVALYDGAHSISSGTANLNASGALTVSITNQSLNMSVPGVTSVSATGILSMSTTGNTVSMGVPAYSAGISTQGNTSGTTGFATNQLVLAGGNNITLSQGTGTGGNTITISAGAGGAADSNTFGMSNLGNTSGNTGVVSGTNLRYLIAGGNNITLNQSLNGSSATLSISAPAISQLTYTGAVSMSSNGSTVSIGAPAFSAGISNLSNDSGSTGMITNRLVLAGGSNITLSQSTNASGATVSVIGGAGGGGGGGGVALYDGAHSISSGTANLNASGALTVSITNQSLNMSVPATSSLSVTGAISLTTNGNTISLGAPAASSLVGVNGVTLSTNGSTVSISGPGNIGTISNWEPAMLQHAPMTVMTLGAKNQFFMKLTPQAYVSASQLMQLATMLYTTMSGTHRGTLSAQAGIYSVNGATLSLITQSSGSASYTWSANSNNANTSVLTGVHGFTIPMNFVASPGNYWIGIWSNTSISSGSLNISNLVINNNSVMMGNASSYNGLINQGPTATQGIQEGVGYYSNTTIASIVGSAAMSHITQNVGTRLMGPYLAFKNITW